MRSSGVGLSNGSRELCSYADITSTVRPERRDKRERGHFFKNGIDLNFKTFQPPCDPSFARISWLPVFHKMVCSKVSKCLKISDHTSEENVAFVKIQSLDLQRAPPSKIEAKMVFIRFMCCVHMMGVSMCIEPQRRTNWGKSSHPTRLVNFPARRVQCMASLKKN